MSVFVSLSEASKLTSRSVSWARNKAKSLEQEGRASKKSGRWEIERAAILSLTAASLKAQNVLEDNQVLRIESQVEATLRDQIEGLKQDKRDLKEELQNLRSENVQLQAEVRGFLSQKPDGKMMSALSRWIRI